MDIPQYTQDSLLYKLTDSKILLDTFDICKKKCQNNQTMQDYYNNLLDNTLELQYDLRTNNYHTSPTSDFILNERGKIRYIHAPHIRDRIVQKILVNQVLIPQLEKYLIYDNAASREGKGTSFIRSRLYYQLLNYAQIYGNEGYILLMDIKNYFASISHEKLLKMLISKIEDPSLHNVIEVIVNESSDTNYGLNLGSEAPQFFAIFYMHRIDNYIKIVRGQKCYGRFMDDFYCINRDKEFLKELKSILDEQLAELDLHFNQNKTQIVKLSHGFNFLKCKYIIDNSGKISVIPLSSKIHNLKTIINKNIRLVEVGDIAPEQALVNYKSARNSLLSEGNCKRSIAEFDEYFLNHFYPLLSA